MQTEKTKQNQMKKVKKIWTKMIKNILKNIPINTRMQRDIENIQFIECSCGTIAGKKNENVVIFLNYAT